jgi:hypothetical protein
MEDYLRDDSMVVLCVKANPDEGIEDHTVYVWMGTDFEPSSTDIDPNEYIEQVKKNYWGESLSKI